MFLDFSCKRRCWVSVKAAEPLMRQIVNATELCAVSLEKENHIEFLLKSEELSPKSV